jgi:hypothetical protein
MSEPLTDNCAWPLRPLRYSYTRTTQIEGKSLTETMVAVGEHAAVNLDAARRLHFVLKGEKVFADVLS